MSAPARALKSVFLALALLSPLAFVSSIAAAYDSGSASFRNTRSDVNAGGRRKTSTNYREDSSVGSIAQSTATSASYLRRDGLQSHYHQPARVTDLFASSTSVNTQIYLQWTSPGNDGVDDSAPGRYLVRYSSIASESPAISDAKWDAATPISPEPGRQKQGSLIGVTLDGLTPGVTYYFALKTSERDGIRSILSAGATAQTAAPDGCVAVRNVHQTDGPYTTIQAAVDALPSALAGHSCVLVRDAATYAEQVTVQNFTNNGSSITIKAYPGALRPVVDPPGASTAAFFVKNASVNIMGFDLKPTVEQLAFGVYASSEQLKISSVNVDAGGQIWDAGFEIAALSRVEYSSVTVQNAEALALNASSGSVVTRSSFTRSSGARTLGLEANSDFNELSYLYVRNTSDDALVLDAGCDYNTLLRSSVTTTNGGAVGLYLNGADNNTVSESYLFAAGANAILDSNASNGNVVRRSTASTDYLAAAAIRVNGDAMIIEDSLITRSNGTGPALLLDVDSSLAQVLRSTIVANSGHGLQVRGSSNSIHSAYVQASTAVQVSGSTGTVIESSVLVATSTVGVALQLTGGSLNLTLSSSTLSAPAQGVGLSLGEGNGGLISLSSVVVLSAGRGVELSTLAAGFALDVDSITFRGLAPGATAIHFLGGAFVSTITLANFEDANVGANVSGAALDLASRVTMRSARGARRGPDFENDPNSLVDWADFIPPADVALWFVGMSSAGLQYGLVGADGYVVQASTRSDFQAGVTVSSTVFGAQDRLAALPLMPNTTYFLRAGALWSGTTVYAGAVFSSSTLSQLVAGTTVYQINVTSMVVNWVPLLADVSSNSASGYRLEASTMASFAPLWSSSFTPNVALSTLAVGGLRGGVTYYFRVGTLNHASVAHFASAVSTLMPVQLGVELTTHTISLPGLVSMNSTVVITTSVVVSNTGNVKETYWVRATTLTASSPWRIGPVRDVDQFILSMVINPTEPTGSDFNADDKLAETEQGCTGAVFSMGGGACLQVPVGETRLLWFRLDTPLVTSTTDDQDIRIFVRAARDPDPDPNP